VTAHHLHDQAETVALRQARASGPDGLAGMAAVRELAGLRLLRPLLTVPKSALLAYLDALGQPLLDDPSNRAQGFARTRLRGPAGLDVAPLARLAARQSAARAAWEREVAAWLAQHARIFAAGFVLMAHAGLVAAPVEIARRAVQQTLLAVGGRAYPPRRARLARLLDELRSGRRLTGRTLGGCRLLRRADRLLVCREAGAITDVLEPRSGAWQSWDGRFAVRLTGELAGLSVRALGAEGWRQRGTLAGPSAAVALPAVVRSSLPAVWRGDRLLAVPELDLIAPDYADRLVAETRYQPAQPLAGAPFAAGPPPVADA
jgi:tRNA(Ile)-lysidine synthase